VQTGCMRVEIYVRPSASATVVGGEYGGAMVVRVVEPPDHGRATDAALRAVADALSVPRRAVTLVRGTTSRRKVIDIEVTHSLEEPLETAWRRLLDHSDGP
jgi:uncharacterized protein